MHGALVPALFGRRGTRPALSLDFTTGFDSRITYTGASLATMRDTTGKLTYKPNQLFLHSADFSQAAWTKTNCPISGTGSVTLPAGTVAKHISQTVNMFSQSQFMWFDVIAGTHSFFQIINSGDAETFANFNAATGATGTKGTKTLSGVVDLGGGAYRLWVKFTNGVSSNNWRIYAVDSASATYAATTSSTGTFTLLGSGLSAVTYETAPRSDDLVTTGASAYYGPRRDCDVNGSVIGVLVEEGRTNLDINSTSLTTGWTANVSTNTANSATSPDGTVNAARILATAGAGAHCVYSSAARTATTGVDYSITRYVKKDTSRYWYLASSVSSTNYIAAVFDLDAAGSTATETSVGASSGTITSTSKVSVGDGWYRLEIVGKITGASRFTVLGIAGAATGNTFDTSGNVTFNAAGTEAGWWYGPQLELGSFATSYIPTGASSAARAADSVSMTGTNFSSWYNQSEGTFIVEANTFARKTSDYLWLVSGAGTGFHEVTIQSGNLNSFTRQSSGANVVSINHAIIASVAFRHGYAYKTDDFAATLNGAVPTTDTAGGMPDTATAFYIGRNTTAAQWNGWIKSISYYNRRLSNADLQRLAA